MPKVTEQVGGGAGRGPRGTSGAPVCVAKAFWGEASEASGLPPPTSDPKKIQLPARVGN